MSALAFYEKLSRDEKTKYFLNEQEFKPVPDYQQRWVGREFQRAYLFQRLLLVERLRQYMVRTRFINEFPQGFKQNQSTGYLENDKQFDLVVARKQK